MKISLFSYVFWPEQFLINELVRDLDKSKISINVLTGLPNYPAGEFFEGYTLTKGPYVQHHYGAMIRRYPIVPRKKGFFWRILNYGSHLLGALLAQFSLSKADWAFVFATSPITTAIPAIIWAKLNHAKVCIWLQDLWPESVLAVGAASRKSLIYKVLGKIVSWIYQRTDLILIQSPAFKDNLNEYGYNGPVHVVPNWAPDVNYQSTNTPAWLLDLPTKFTVTFAGNVGIAQAVDTVIEAAIILKSNSDIQFAIVGDGSELARIKEIVQKHALSNVYFFGRRPLEDMPALFRRSGVLLVSLRDDLIFAKTIPSKIQAYMASGKPLIASLNGAGADIILEAKCGFSVPAEDGECLAEAIEKMALLSEEDRRILGDNARSYFYENYRKDRIIEQIISYLERYK